MDQASLVHEFYAGEEINAGDAVSLNYGGILFRTVPTERYPPIGVALHRAITTQACKVVMHGVAPFPEGPSAVPGTRLWVGQNGGTDTSPPHRTGSFMWQIGICVSVDEMIVQIQDHGRRP